MEENQSQDSSSSVQIKQEHLIYGIAAAVVVIVILIGAILYIVSGSGSTPQQNGGAPAQSLPPGHPPVQEGQQAGPLTQDQLKGAGTGSGSTSPGTAPASQ